MSLFPPDLAARGITHFSLAEFTRSTDAARRGIDNSVPDLLMPNAIATLQMAERIRAFLSQRKGRDVPIAITSGFRCPAVNNLVGSKLTSDHPKACAIDFHADAYGTPTDICQALRTVMDNLGIGQLINEFPSDNGGWVHVSTRMPDAVVNRVLTINTAGTRAGIWLA